jgi:hypothetical protein
MPSDIPDEQTLSSRWFAQVSSLIAAGASSRWLPADQCAFSPTISEPATARPPSWSITKRDALEVVDDSPCIAAGKDRLANMRPLRHRRRERREQIPRQRPMQPPRHGHG